MYTVFLHRIEPFSETFKNCYAWMELINFIYKQLTIYMTIILLPNGEQQNMYLVSKWKSWPSTMSSYSDHIQGGLL